MNSAHGILPARIATVVLMAAVAILGTVAVCAVVWKDGSVNAVQASSEQCHASAAMLAAMETTSGAVHDCGPGARAEARIVWEGSKLYALVLCQCDPEPSPAVPVADAGVPDVSGTGGEAGAADAGGP